MKSRGFYAVAGAAYLLALLHVLALACSGCSFASSGQAQEDTTGGDAQDTTTDVTLGNGPHREENTGELADGETSDGEDTTSTTLAEEGASSSSSTESRRETGDVDGEEESGSSPTTSGGSESESGHPSCVASCCSPHQGGGCDDAVVEQCVCAYDDGVTNGSACCSLVWGVFCVEVATTVCGFDCEGCT